MRKLHLRICPTGNGSEIVRIKHYMRNIMEPGRNIPQDRQVQELATVI